MAVAFYFFFYQLVTKKNDKKFAVTDFIEMDTNYNSYTDREESFIIRYFKPLISFTKKRMNNDKTEELQMKLKQAHMKQSPEAFIALKVVYSTIFGAIFLVLFVINQNIIMLILGVASSIYMYLYPNRILKKNLKYANEQKKIELPDYFTPLAKLMISFPPYQAVRECEKFAGPFLKPYVKQLQVEMDLYPGSIKPFQNFADRIGVRQAKTFVAALHQALNTDAKKARETLENQVAIMRQLRKESYNEEINKRPLLVNKYNAILLFDMALIPISLLIYTFYKMFTF